MATDRGVEVQIDGIAAGGAGVGRLHDGRAVFVHRTAPGDLARVRLTQEKRRWARGRLVHLDQPGPARRVPACPLYDRCGGCTLSHLDYDEQVRRKCMLVQEAFRRIGGLSIEIDAVTRSPSELRYRSRMSFTLRRLRGGRVVAGLHELHAPSRVLDVGNECLLPSPAVSRAWQGLRSAWGSGARRLPEGGELRLTLREVEEGVVLVVGGGSGSWDGGGLLEDVEGLVAVWHRPAPGAARLVAGTADTGEQWLGERYEIGASTFLQVNRPTGEVLHARVLELAGQPVDSVIDAYAGVGVYGRALARSARRVVAIEVDPVAADAARAEAPPGLTVLVGRVEDRLSEGLPAELVILNPPRSGLHPDVPDMLVRAAPSRVIYVSCDPATLARDVARLAPVFETVRVEVFDLFPQTAHVETVALLVARERD